ncbi:MAG TPA: hypothetical protein VF210_11180 [Pseudomonadales bacterium]
MSGARSKARARHAVGCAGLVAALFAPSALAAPELLDENALERVGVDAAARSTLTRNSAAEPAPRRDLIVVDRSNVTADHGAAVELGGDSQRGLRAANVVNAAAADAVGTVNVAMLFADAPAPAIRQLNDLGQHEARIGLLPGQVLPDAPLERRESSAFSRGSSLHQLTSQAIIDRETLHSVETQRLTATIPSFSPAREWEVELDLGTMPPITIPAFGFDWTAGEEPFRFGVAANFSSFGLSGAGLSLGKIGADGDDLVIGGGHITLPTITLPTVEGTLCAFVCASGTVRGTTIQSQTLSLDVGDIRLAGANPFKDIDLQLGQGIAAVGSGTFSVQGGGAKVTAELSFQLPSIGGQSITLDLLPSLAFMSEEELEAASKVLGGPPSVTIELPEIELPSGSFELELVDFDAPGASGSFGFSGRMEDAVLCLSVTTTNCADQRFSREESHVRVLDTVTVNEESRSEWEERSESRKARERPGAAVGDLEAERMALAGGELAVDDYRVVNIGGNAQRDLRALNLSNVTTALVGSSVNVLGTARAAGSAAPGLLGRVNQSNVFVQGFR